MQNGLNQYIGKMGSEELASEIHRKIDGWNASLTSNGLIEIWLRNYRLYYNNDPYWNNVGHWNDFGPAGEQGEYLNIRINHFRNLIAHLINMMFSKLPSMKSRAANSSAEAISSVGLCDGILENVFQTKKAGRHVKKCGEMAMLFGTAALFAEWDTNSGDPYLTDGQGKLVSTGDIKIRSKSPLDFYADTNKEDWEDVDWVVVRDFVNKYVLAAQYPDLANQILNIKTDINKAIYFFDLDNSDDIPVYKFFHKPVPGLLPEGRYHISVSDDVVLYDGINPYGQIPLFLIKPSEGLGTFYGYSAAFDLAPMQIFYNLVMSSIATNVSALAVPNIVTFKGSDLSLNSIAGGMNQLQVTSPEYMPQTLNLLATPPEVYQLSQIIERLMETISGVNSVTRGNPESSLKSGVALGLVQSMAIQFASGFQQSIINGMEDLANYVLKLYKQYASTERVVSIVGKDKINEIKRWNSEDLQLVENIYVEPVDPYSQTLAGRESRADKLIDKGLVGPQEYLTVATTGQLEPLYKRPMSELNYIRDENSDLMQGVYVDPLFTDNHPLHIDEHLTLTFDKTLRQKASIPGSKEEYILSQVFKHVQEHKNLLDTQQMTAIPAQAEQTGMPVPEQGQTTTTNEPSESMNMQMNQLPPQAEAFPQ